MIHRFDYLVIGAGFAGSTVAEQLASAGAKVLIIDRREHIGGNAFDELDSHGVRVHRYGPHIFHTNGRRIIEYLSRFTNWRFYEHRVRAIVNSQPYVIPINRDTINRVYNLHLEEHEIAAFLETIREPRNEIRTSEDVVLNSVGRKLYEMFFLNYTRKQWGLDPSQLSAGVAARIPVRTNSDDRYFSDTYQLMPMPGYAEMFTKMLSHPNIEIRLKIDYKALRESNIARKIVFTGPIDEYFDYCFGKLPYRSLRFEHEHVPNVELNQIVGTLNFPNDHTYTRITEFKHLTGQLHSGTSLVREYPQELGDPYYPIPRPENEALYKRYAELAQKDARVTFVGRLAQYRYYNMDQVVAAALKAAERLLAA